MMKTLGRNRGMQAKMMQQLTGAQGGGAGGMPDLSQMGNLGDLSKMKFPSGFGKFGR